MSILPPKICVPQCVPARTPALPAPCPLSSPSHTTCAVSYTVWHNSLSSSCTLESHLQDSFQFEVDLCRACIHRVHQIVSTCHLTTAAAPFGSSPAAFEVNLVQSRDCNTGTISKRTLPPSKGNDDPCNHSRELWSRGMESSEGEDASDTPVNCGGDELGRRYGLPRTA